MTGLRGSPIEPCIDYVPPMDGVGPMTETEREWFEERAAIAEFDAGWPRPIAEAEARRIIGASRSRTRISGLISGHLITPDPTLKPTADMSASRGQ